MGSASEQVVNLLAIFDGVQAERTAPRGGDPGTFVNPFSLRAVNSIDIEINPNGITFAKPGVFVRAKVWFTSGDTRGTHNIDARTLDEVLPKLKSFLEALR